MLLEYIFDVKINAQTVVDLAIDFVINLGFVYSSGTLSDISSSDVMLFFVFRQHLLNFQRNSNVERMWPRFI